jgi:hypothetical protein
MTAASGEVSIVTPGQTPFPAGDHRFGIDRRRFPIDSLRFETENRCFQFDGHRFRTIAPVL